MPINVLQLLVSKRIMERANVPADRATRLALVPAVLNAGLVESVLVSTAIARREGTDAPPVPPAGKTVEVPDVVGKTRDEAVETLKGASLAASVREVSAQPAGKVVAQGTDPQTQVPEGSEVLLNVVRADPAPPTGAKPG